MLPNMTDALSTFKIDLELRRVEQVILNARPVDKEVNSTIRAVVQVADPDEINSEAVDFSKKYLLVHTSETVNNIDQCSHNGINYRAFSIKDYDDYGYTEAIFEEVQ